MNGVGFLLRCSHPQASSRIYSLQKADIIIGRAMECDVVLDAANVSRQHARIQFTAQGIFLTDLGSTNGTQLKGAPLSPRRPVSLEPGQPFTVADFTLLVERQLLQPLSSAVRSDLQPAPSAAQMESATLQSAEFPGIQLGVAQTLDLSAQSLVTVGRGADNTLVLNHPMVSRCHAEIERVGARVLLRDLRSTNGAI